MPLTRTPPSASRAQRAKIHGANVKELVDSFDSSGSIGTSRPRDRAAAIKQAVAVSYAQARRRKRAR